MLGIGDLIHPESALGFFDALTGQRDRPGFFIDDIIGFDIVVELLVVTLHDLIGSKLSDEFVGLQIQIGGFFSLPRNDQRGPRLVD
ncbi:hypothetical protein SDC9_94951 [bioreactor metagenome]|uniref:Uncharacterized protein n=1 Tax=bioreactor metagenome TaxID=1076179 RepID=A0A645A570_9ZZZZ